MGPLRGKKGSNYEGGLRIPMIVRWPGQVAAGAVSDFPWSFADVLPTLADLAGARGIPRQVDGISVAPMLLGRKQNAERPIYWESHDGGGFQQAVRLGPWKALRSGLEGAVELYDLSVDPGEKANVAATQPAVVRRIEEFLTSARMDAPEYPFRGRRRVSLSPRP